MFIYQLIHSGLSPKEIILLLLLYFLVLSLAFGFHEFMHAFVAYKLGDDTPMDMGRVTLNPLAHIDFMGMIMLVLMGFGWGKPVSWRVDRVTKCKPKTAIILVSLAGVTGNFILAIIGEILAVVFAAVIGPQVIWRTLILTFFQMFIEVNLALLAFNLLPIPPLDGFQFINELLPLKLRYSDGYKKFVAYAPMILMAVILIGSFANISILSLLIDAIELPFKFVLSLIGTLIGTLMYRIMG